MNVERRGFLKVLGGLAVAALAPVRAAMGDVARPRPEAPGLIGLDPGACDDVAVVTYQIEDRITASHIIDCDREYNSKLAEAFARHFDDEMIRLANQGSCLVRVPKELKR